MAGLVRLVGVTVVGLVVLGIGVWLGVIAYLITGTRVRIGRDGVESRMGLRRFYRWLEVPDLTVDRQVVVLRAAGARRPRVWIRCAVPEVSVPDRVAVIRRQRGW